MKKLLVIVSLLTLTLSIFVGCSTELEKLADDDTVYTYSASLTGDVASAGTAKMVYKEDAGFNLKATFANLPALEGTDFYEGWIVVEDAKPVSTGKVSAIEGVYVNLFSSDTDYSSYDKYVLTLEPDDANPEPSSEHVLEGNFELMTP